VRAVSGSGLRAKLHRQAATILPLLGAGWVSLVSVQAGGRSARVVFAKQGAKDRIILSQNGASAAVNVTNKRLAARLSRILRAGAEGRA